MISILVHTTDYRGDHTAEVCIALDYEPGESIEDLIARAGFNGEAPSGAPRAYDRIEIRVGVIVAP